MQRLRRPVGLLLVGTLLVSQFSMLAVAGTTGDSHGGHAVVVQSSDIEVVGVEMPAKMRPGEEYEVRIRIRNTGDSAQNVKVAYSFDGRELRYYDELVPAGETIEGSLPVTVRGISQSRADPLYDGQYTHSMAAGDVSVTRNVTISGIGTPTPTPTAIGETDGTQSGDAGAIKLVSLEFPDEIPVGGKAPAQVTTRNPSDEMASTEVALTFEGEEIIRTQVSFPPGEETTPLPIEYRMLTNKYGEIEPGTYSWRMSVNGTVRSGIVDIVPSEDGSTANGESAGQASTTSEPASQASPEQPKRGFFSNGESQFEFLDSFSLTVGGFVLSAVGIFYQMLQGA